ncbi:hypothetical protein [Streptomyces sp. NBC_01565]|uniref:hypothetical protein n=1 Tax=unclassified Streptomyces TaxID=2593676 RepID=UPI002B1CDA2F|nr:hypothetical protein [Streptomyces sp. NBC_01565]
MSGKDVGTGPDFSSSSLPRHLARGAMGFGGLIGSIALVPGLGPVALLLLPIGVLALRGCPMCWAIGLLQTLSRGRLQRSCVGGTCELSVAHRPTGRHPAERPRPAGSPVSRLRARGRSSRVRE